jgi:hypothetical protein
MLKYSQLLREDSVPGALLFDKTSLHSESFYKSHKNKNTRILFHIKKKHDISKSLAPFSIIRYFVTPLIQYHNNRESVAEF